MKSDKTKDLAILGRLLKLAKPYWGHVAGIFALDLLATPLALLTPIPLMLAVDSVIGSKPFPHFFAAVVPESWRESTASALVLIAALVVLIALLRQIQGISSWLLQTYTGEKLALEFRARLLRHAQRLSLAYHDSKGTADSIYRIQYDAPAIQWAVIQGLTPFFTAAFTLIGMIVITMQLDWQLGLIAIAVSPALALFTQVFRKRLRHQWRSVKNLETSALSLVQETLAALRVVKAFGQEEREHSRFVSRSSESLRARVRVVVSESAFNLLVGLTIAIGTALVLFIGVKHVQAGLLTLGQLLLVMSYLAQLYQPLQTIGQQMAHLQGSLTSAERAFALLDQSTDVTERPDAQPIRHAGGEVQFDNVTFSYDGSHPVFHGVSFSVPAGTRVGIVGRTGAGKTTLINLLIRFYDPSQGRILLDGVDLRDYKLADLRDQFAIVLQEPVLLSSSIAENIAYGRPGASATEIIQAAKAANADEFITELPQGYETPVGERGMQLSGGQRQRIALARAFLKDAPILILDEPTSSVDTATEAAIMEAMERLMQGRTTFMIAHRLSTLEICNYRIEIEDGRLVSATGNGTTEAVIGSSNYRRIAY